MYTYYETFKYRSRSSKIESLAIYVHKIDVYPNPQPRLVEKIVRKHGQKAVTKTRFSNKLYVRTLVRKTRVSWKLDSCGNRAETLFNYVENYILNTYVGVNPANVLKRSHN